VIKRHGNFDEIWQRNIGRGSSYGLERNVNALIRDGGIMFPLVLD
jgi:general L-amino acid transport system substrate-binding protein